jgi:hypothetical protein
MQKCKIGRKITVETLRYASHEVVKRAFESSGVGINWHGPAVVQQHDCAKGRSHRLPDALA